MTRETVDYGIDLGTTNSAAARSTGADAEIVRNNLREEYTPSAVYIGKSGTARVGRAARAKVEDDPANAHAEFKLQMGVRDAYRSFAASGRTLTPEQLSAEVLKSLREDVREAYEEEISAAVITVPAAFELDQCEATRRAAGLAGLEFAPLLQEPTAAAWAYSAAATDVPRRGFWLVYDLGGGTFDAAVIQIDDGEFSVVNHAGDNFLGGKVLDWKLVDDLLVPAARTRPGLGWLDRSQPRQSSNVARLKHAAENAKIALSRARVAEVDLMLDAEDGSMAEFTYEVTREDAERLAMPLYRRSVELCHRALAEKGMAPGDIERILLVGGATLAPGLRDLLADPVEGLGIRLDHSLDPVTVVARGAAIFAATQRLPHTFKNRAAQVGEVLLDFVHKPTGRSAEPLVGGRARAADGDDDRDWSGCTVEFVEDAENLPEWHSGHIPLRPDGSFSARLLARSARNSYAIRFRTPQGAPMPTRPDRTSYQRLELEGGNATLSHSVGVWLEGNEVAWILRKGAELPARARVVLVSTEDVRRGEGKGLIRVPIVQGERARADRNPVVGRLDVRPEEISRDVPVGSEIEVIVEIDQSFRTRVDAYIPVLDEEFEIDVELARDRPDVTGLRAQGTALTDQYKILRARAATAEAERTAELLDEFDQDGGLDAIDGDLETAEADLDSAANAQERIRKAETALDEAEEALRLPQVVREAEQVLEWVREAVRDLGDAADLRDLGDAEALLDTAIAAGDPAGVDLGIDAVRNLGLRVLDAADQLPVLRFMSLKDAFATSADARVRRLLRDGEAAVTGNDIGRLRSVVTELQRLVPSDPGPAGGPVDTTVRLGRHR
jgi:molecular chaperone DnaK